MPQVTVRVPVRGEWESVIRVPDAALLDIAGFLDENPEYLTDIEQNGQLINEQMLMMEVQIVD